MVYFTLGIFLGIIVSPIYNYIIDIISFISSDITSGLKLKITKKKEIAEKMNSPPIQIGFISTEQENDE